MSTARRRVLLAAAGGAAAAVCWMPFGLAPLFPLALVPALRGLRLVETPRQALVFGLVFGASRYAVASHFLLWLLAYSPLAIVFYLLAIAFILPFGALEGWGALQLERRLGVPRTPGFGLIFAALEYVRTLGDLSFPADLLAHSFGTAPSWLAWSAWLGPFGMTLLIFAVAALLDRALSAGSLRGRALAAAGACALWAGPPVTAGLLATHAHGPVLRVGLVQPATPVGDKLERSRWDHTWQVLEELTLQVAGTVDLVVWPETARPGPAIWRGGPFSDPRVQELADRAGVPILYGCDIGRLDGGRAAAIYNGAALARPGADTAEWYGKQRLLPFVEGIPFASWIGLDPSKRDRSSRSVLTLLGNFSPGPGPGVFEVGTARIGVLICYEGLYPGLARAARAAGANALVVLTNDTWWGDSIFPRWHSLMVASRARELGIPVLRAANDGISSLTDARGCRTAATSLSSVTTLCVPLQPSTDEPTAYARSGDLVLPLAVLALGAVGVGRLWRARGAAPATAPVLVPREELHPRTSITQAARLPARQHRPGSRRRRRRAS